MDDSRAKMGVKASQGARSRERILRAASRLLASRSFAGASMSAVARKAGLPSIYWHFGSKAGLLAAVTEDSSRRVADMIPPVKGLGADPEDRFARWLDELAEANLSECNRDLMRLSFTLWSELFRDSNKQMLEAARRAREHELEVLREVLTPIFAELGEDEASRIADELALVTLHFGEGSTLAYLIDPERTDLRKMYTTFRRSILALAHKAVRDARERDQIGIGAAARSRARPMS